MFMSHNAKNTENYLCHMDLLPGLSFYCISHFSYDITANILFLLAYYKIVI